MRRAWGLRAVVLALLAALPFVIYPQFVSDQAFMYGFDAGQNQLARIQIMRHAFVDQGRFPLWQSTSWAGSPFHANPESADLYPPVVLFSVAFPPVLAMNLTVLMHLGLACVGMAVLTLRLWRRLSVDPRLGSIAGAVHPVSGLAGAAVAGVLFGLSYMTRLSAFNMVTYGAAHALIPWIVWALDGLLTGAAPRRWAGGLAWLCALQVFTGGLYVYPYTLFAVVVWGVGLGLAGGREARRRTLTWGVAAGGLLVLLVLAKLLPYPAWVATTSRAGGLDLAAARGTTIAGVGSFSWTRLWGGLLLRTGSGAQVALLVLAVPLLRTGLGRMIVLLGVFGAVTAAGWLHDVLFYVPPFGIIRNAERAWTLSNVFLPLASGLGLCWGLQRLPVASRRTRAWLEGAVGVILVAAALPLVLDTGRYQGAFEDPFRYDDALAMHANWNAIARNNAADERAICLNIHRLEGINEQFITAALGLQSPAGALGSAMPVAIGRHAYSNGGPLPLLARLKRLRVLSVGPFVRSEPMRIYFPPPTSRDVTRPGGIDGEFVGRIAPTRPRAFLPVRVAGLIGDADHDVLYELFDQRDFSPMTASLVSLDDGPMPDADELAALDVLVDVAGGPGRPAAQREAILAAARDAGLVVVQVGSPLTPADTERLASVAARLGRPRGEERPRGEGRSPGEDRSLEDDGAAAPDARFMRIDDEHLRVDLAPAEAPRYVVVSETWALYGGWDLRVDGRSAVVRSADGVVSAVSIPAGASRLEALYAPTDALLGLALAALGGLVALALIVWPGPRAAPRAARTSS